MKKITAIVSSLILSASLLVGCGASSAPAPTTAPATTPAATVAAETAAETTEAKSFSVAIVQQLSHHADAPPHAAPTPQRAHHEPLGMVCILHLDLHRKTDLRRIRRHLFQGFQHPAAVFQAQEIQSAAMVEIQRLHPPPPVCRFPLPGIHSHRPGSL